MVATIVVELLLLMLLFGLTPSIGVHHGDKSLKVFTITPDMPAHPTFAQPSPQPSRAAAHPAASPPPKPAPATPTNATPAVVAPTAMPVPAAQPPSPAPSPTPPTPAAPATPHQTYGPPAPGPDPTDTAIVGTAPNGEPLYAAAWYREPYDDELRGYLSTAQGPGWALIGCRVVPDFRVEDCVGLGENPPGSNIERSVLAAAWQFKVRPPRHGGKNLWGSWVRIRIDYMERPASLAPSRR